MNHIESKICILCEDLKSNEIESIISELQMIADRKYQDEEDRNIYQEELEMYHKKQ